MALQAILAEAYNKYMENRIKRKSNKNLHLNVVFFS